MKRRMTTVWRNGELVTPARFLEAGQGWYLALIEAAAADRRNWREAEADFARDAELVGAQLGARPYGVSRRSVADKGRVERLALGRG